VNDNEPHTIGFSVVYPERDGARVRQAVHDYHARTGFLPSLTVDQYGMWLRAPDDVFIEWITAFGVTDEDRKNFPLETNTP
jgi:hypothetical protein